MSEIVHVHVHQGNSQQLERMMATVIEKLGDLNQHVEALDKRVQKRDVAAAAVAAANESLKAEVASLKQQLEDAGNLTPEAEQSFAAIASHVDTIAAESAPDQPAEPTDGTGTGAPVPTEQP